MPQPVSWWRVIKASRILTKTAAVVWDEYRFRDNGDGAWPHVNTVANACGLSPRTVEGTREDLKRLGLLQPERRGNKTHWHVMLLEGLYPSQRPTDEEVTALAAQLDDRLQAFDRSTTPANVAGGAR